MERARALAGQAEAAARSITLSDPPGRILAALVNAAAALGGLDRAETLAESITDPTWRVPALTRLAEAAAAAGDMGRARALAGRAEKAAGTITNPNRRAQALADLARKAAPNQAHSLLAQALTAGHWQASVVVLVQLNPAAAKTIVDEHMTANVLMGHSP
jgi:hypothetical protein